METLTVIPEEEELPQDLALILTRAKARSKIRNRDLKIVAGIALSIILAAMIIVAIIPVTVSLVPGVLTIYCSLIAFILFTLTRRRKGVYGLNEQDYKQLATINDKRVLKVLLDVPFDHANKSIASQREGLLKHWLPSLHSEHTDFLSKRQKQHLTGGIHIFEEDVTQEIFRILEQIGDKNQIASLKYWKTNTFGKGVKPETLAAYKSCLAAIEARTASSRSDSQLLRPSFPTDGADTYLRPVTQKIDENSETLLRSDLTPDLAHSAPLLIPSCLGEEGEPRGETVGDDRTESKP